MKSIIITINTDGSRTLEVKGVKGKGCDKETASLETALGMDPSDRQHKPEWHEPETQREQN